MGTRPHYFAILVVDIEGFGKRRNPVQQLLRTRLYDIVKDALTESGVTDLDAVPCSDQGDGAFWLLPTAISKVSLTGPFIGDLNARLAEHARVCRPEAALRLRVALHAGEVGRDEHGWVGADLNAACRLVDLDALRIALASAPCSDLALAISETWYAAVVQHDYPGTERGSFLQVPFLAKEIRQTAWIRIPGYDRPPGLSGGADGPGGDMRQPPVQPDPPDTSARPHTSAPDGALPDCSPRDNAPPSAPVNMGPFAGATINAKGVYNGPHLDFRKGRPSDD
jgi:hypothetical protein